MKLSVGLFKVPTKASCYLSANQQLLETKMKMKIECDIHFISPSEEDFLRHGADVFGHRCWCDGDLIK